MKLFTSDVGIQIALFVSGLIVLIYVKQYYFEGISTVVDTTSQITQAKVLASGDWTISVPEALQGFAKIQAGFGVSELASHFPPGYIVLLTIGELLGKVYWVSLIIGALTLPLMYSVGKKLIGSRLHGMTAALLLGTSPFFLLMSAEGMNHALVLYQLILLIHIGIKVADNRGDRWLLIAGFILAWSFAVRPLNGIIYTFCFSLFMICQQTHGSWKRQIICLTAGALPVIFFLCYYNAQTTGAPFTFGYQMVNAENNMTDIVEGEMLSESFFMRCRRYSERVMQLSQGWLHGWGICNTLLIILWCFQRKKNLWELLLFVLIVLQTSGYFIYHFSDLVIGPRFWYEITGPLILLELAAIKRLIDSTIITDPYGWSKPVALILVILLTSHALTISLPRYGIKFREFAGRGLRLQEARRDLKTDTGILLISPGYHDWMWIFEEDFNSELYYIPVRDKIEIPGFQKTHLDIYYLATKGFESIESTNREVSR